MEKVLYRPSRPARAGFWTRLVQANAVYRERRHLEMLDDHMLRDIGLDREGALEEAARTAWDVPRHWRE